jgi:hypothetical protein
LAVIVTGSASWVTMVASTLMMVRVSIVSFYVMTFIVVLTVISLLTVILSLTWVLICTMHETKRKEREWLMCCVVKSCV